MAWGSFLLDWVLIFNPLVAVIIISVLVSVLVTLSYKYFTNQAEMKDLKKKMDDYRKEMKENKGDIDRLKSIQKESMTLNLEYMKRTFKPTLISFIPLILILGWLGANLAYEPLLPDQTFTINLDSKITGAAVLTASNLTIVSDVNQETKPSADGKTQQAAWIVKGSEGKHFANIDFLGKTYTKDLLITSGQRYINPILTLKNDPNVEKITVGNKKLIVMNLFGWQLGWLGTYIIFSLIISMGLRKLLDIA